MTMRRCRHESMHAIETDWKSLTLRAVVWMQSKLLYDTIKTTSYLSRGFNCEVLCDRTVFGDRATSPGVGQTD